MNFKHEEHPHIEEHKKSRPSKVKEEHVGFNGKIALALTIGVGSMWCAYAFAVLALVALPSALTSVFNTIQWISQTFIQLVMLSVIMVGQNILGKASDKRAEMTYKDAEATFHEARQIQTHLKAQDDAINAILDRLEKFEDKASKG